MKQQYKDIADLFKRYWRIYGGRKSLMSSPYFHAAVLLSFLLSPFWSTPGWWDTVFSTIPSILGFSLGGYAILMALGDNEFQRLITGSKKEKQSPFMDLSVTFAHFIILQIISLIFAIISKGVHLYDTNLSFIEYPIWAASFTIYLYALFCALASVMSLFRVTTWYDRYQVKKQEHSKQLQKSANDENPE